jgi:glutathione S-transferase
MQIGADIYCDTALIAQVLERLAPEPTLYPAASAGLAPLLAQWADSTLFWTTVAYTLQPAGAAHMFAGTSPEAQKAFVDDRAAFRNSVRRLRIAEAATGITSYLQQFQALLHDGRPWLLGSAASIADFSVYHCVWFIKQGGPVVAAVLDQYPRVLSWFERVRQIGHGVSEQLDSKAAIELASRSKPQPVGPEQFMDTHGLPFGTAVSIAATDYGVEPTSGELVISRPDEIGVRRTDPRAGTVIVHFPRLGFEVRKADHATQ